MSWGWPAGLQLLWAAPVVALLLWAAMRRRKTLLARLGALASERVSRNALSIHRTRLLLWFGAMVLCVLALAQPRWGFRWQELKREGLDLVVVLDVSRSMNATDVSPNRMERAQREVFDLTGLLSGDRVGLVVFAGGAYPRMPLTLDYSVLRHQVRDSSAATLVAQGSDIGAALSMAVTLLGPQGAADRAILLISDGEDHEGNAREAAEAAWEAGVHLYTIGIGTTDGAPIPMEKGGFKKDRSGNVVMSRLDEALLQDIARIGHGAYVRSGGGSRDIEGIYVDEIRGRLQGAEQGIRRERLWDERFAWPLSLAVLMLAVGSLLRPGPLRLPGAMLALLWVALASPAAQAGAEEDVAHWIAEQASHPDDLTVAEQLGLALLRAERAAEAHDVLTGVAERSLDPAQRQRARYNAGHAAYQAGRLTRAVEDWRRVLQDAPDHASAEKNAGLVEQEIARRLNQPPPEQQQGEQQQGEQQQGEQQQGEQQQGEQQQGEQQGEAQGPDSLDGRRDAPAEAQDTGAPGEDAPVQAAGEPGSPAEDPATTTGARKGTSTMSAEEAARMVDGVEEGQPQVVAGQRTAGDKDW